MDKTLTELEGDDWGNAADDSTYLIRRSHQLRYVPISRLSIEGLRMLIGQEMGLPWLVGIALDRLEICPCVEGDMYPGDLLQSVGMISRSYWKLHPDQESRLSSILAKAMKMECADNIDTQYFASIQE
ncbi:contact-dependent growth inhibition system immunity protein [Glycomyces tritici]|uniref:Contact-dependent growth inhibition system immunity protein n=1 Tax=Glycomyces tritici TaxID=2665176 RepID=A0ABT7YXU1_9ACTN|nr:contact-dependent growth inhibition system immunity protein [Glycomyces tritici]MDN3243048.1 contact-dependent growth inhibition system immunity protein [Glycomyces tritici]